MEGDVLVQVERQRANLEDQVTKLRKALRHWQTWEIDYEGLKEEIRGLPMQSSTDDLFKAAQDFKAELVDDNELRSLLGHGTSRLRTQQQVVDLISRRIDYVSRNSQTVQRQLYEAERKRNALLLLEDSDHHEEAGLPLTEITEELDEDGNVLSSSINAPARKAPELLELLQKAGVREILDSNGLVKAVRNERRKQSDALDPSVPTPLANHDDIGDAELMNSDSPVSSKFTPGQPPKDTSLQVQGSKLFHPNIPANESSEDAALRQEMIDYQSGLDEVGAVVAELELEEGGTDNESMIEDMDDMAFDETDSDGSEDEYGRSKKSPITEAYRRRMLTLERKLNARGMQNLGPEHDLPRELKAGLVTPSTESAQMLPKAKVGDRIESPNKDSSAKKAKKKVAFAEELDIAPATKSTELDKDVAIGALIKTNGVERLSTDSLSIVEPSQLSAKKPSRFKGSLMHAARQTQETTKATKPTTPNPSSSSKTTTASPLSTTVLERPVPSAARPQSPSDIEQRMHNQEIMSDFHKIRNRMIQQQGGFVEERELEQEVVPIPEEMGGKRVSRFKAARLK